MPIVATVLVAISAGSTLSPEVDSNLVLVRALLALPEHKIELAEAKLTVDRMIEPRIDVRKTLQQLDAMASEIRATLPVGASSRVKVEALRSFLYDSGRGKSPFQYDQRDPSGRKVENKLLPTYLATRRGNCISMPLLFIVLGQRLGIDVTAATAPEHVFVKFRDESGVWFNLEATSGAGTTSDAWIQKNMPMSPQALANGIYMRPLTKKQTLAVILVTLMEWYRQQGEFKACIALANLLLAQDPHDVVAMLNISGAYYGMLRREFESQYARRADVPTRLRPRLEELEQNLHFWRAKAEALGWREPDQFVSTGDSARASQ